MSLCAVCLLCQFLFNILSRISCGSCFLGFLLRTPVDMFCLWTELLLWEHCCVNWIFCHGLVQLGIISMVASAFRLLNIVYITMCTVATTFLPLLTDKALSVIFRFNHINIFYCSQWRVLLHFYGLVVWTQNGPFYCYIAICIEKGNLLKMLNKSDSPETGKLSNKKKYEYWKDLP